MKFQLIVAPHVMREKFIITDFLGSDDIFALVTKGSFSVERGDTKFIVRANEGALFKKGTLYHRTVLEPVSMYLFRYKSENHAFGSEHVTFKDKQRLTTTLTMLEELDKKVYRDDFEYRNHLFCDLIMQYQMENAQTESIDEPIERAISKINTLLHQSIDLSLIADESGLSYVQFLRRFKAFSGLTPSEYINELRLQKAKQLLTDTSLLVKDIAFSCGFENEYYFSNFFKKHTALSPSAFRKSLSVS